MTKDPQKSKSLLRNEFIARRAEISLARKQEAKKKVLEKLSHLIDEKHRVGSYFPLPQEVDVSLVNEKLAAKNTLALPRMQQHEIHMYLVQNLQTDLEKGNHGFYEPIKESCTKIETIDVALIPAVAFDQAKNRIGFGKGHYDAFLKENPNIWKIGIAFKEQIVDELIQVDSHDVPMNELCIV